MLPRFFSAWVFAATVAVATCAAEQPLVVDFSQSRVDVAVKATMDSFVARLSPYEPAVVVGDDGVVKSARFRFHFRDLATGKAGRDKAMHSWQQTDTFPDGEFVLTSLEPANGQALTAFGRLTLHGVTREIRFPVSIVHEGERYAIDGDAPVDTREFGLPVIRVFAVLKVDPLVHVRFHLQGTLANRATASR